LSEPIQKTRVEFAPKLQFLFAPSRYKVAYGGRGGAKSWGFARALIVLACQQPLRILCVRELQTSIQESVLKLLSDQIESMGLSAFFEVQKQQIYGRNGSQFFFAGIKNTPSKIKSTEGVDICWVEEAQTVSEQSWAFLIPTIRKPGSEIWMSFNPHLATDPTYLRFVTNAPPHAVVVKIGHEDNPWFPRELEQERLYLLRIDPEAHDHVYGGECQTQSEAQVLRGKWCVEPFEPTSEWSGPYFGADWGFSTDPNTLVKCWVGGKSLYIEHEAYGLGVELDDTPRMFGTIPGAAAHTIRADNARPETISYMQRHGFPRVTAAEKWPGSVEDGIAYLRAFERIVIHPQCPHARDEAKLWSYKVDKLTGDVLPDLVDKHNHIWDAVRYALQPIIRKRQQAKRLQLPVMGR
jgi:phage terminase large subunit